MSTQYRKLCFLLRRYRPTFSSFHRTLGGSRLAPTIDTMDNLSNKTISHQGDNITFSFTRPFTTLDDVEITDTPMHLLFAVGPRSGNTLSRHTSRSASPAVCLTHTCGKYSFLLSFSLSPVKAKSFCIILKYQMVSASRLIIVFLHSSFHIL